MEAILADLSNTSLQNPEKKTVGTCSHMCSEYEIQMRERNKLLHPFEILEETCKFKRPKADRTKMIKEYTRPAAGKANPRPSDLRPPPVLRTTMEYLIQRVATRTDRLWYIVYEYVFNRIWAIRQDMVIQQIDGSDAIYILEKIVRFLIYSSYRLCEESMANFDPKINDNHLQECLKRLLRLYDLEEHIETCKNHGEFLTYYLLYNLGNSKALALGLQSYDQFKHHQDYQLALSMALAWWKNNVVKVFKLTRNLTPLQLCAVHRHFPELHRQAFCVMASGFNSKNLRYPLSQLQNLLCLDNQKQAEDLCQIHGLKIFNGGVQFLKSNLQCQEKVPSIHYRWIDERLQTVSICELLDSYLGWNDYR